MSVVVVVTEAKADMPGANPVQNIAAFCRLHQTLDQPGMTLFGANYKSGMVPQPLQDMDVTNWRCMDGKVFVCQNSTSGDWCSKKNSSRKPSAFIKEFCLNTPNSDFVAGVLEYNSASRWRCKGNRPAIYETWALDKRGFMQKMWPRLVFKDGVVVAPNSDDFGTR